MKVSYASPAPGSAHHVTAEALLSATQARMLHVPFKTSQASISGLIRGDVDWMLDLASTVVPLAQAGKVRLLAITGATRTHTAPDVPTAAEALGLPGFESLSWFGLFAPKGIAADQVKVLNRMAANALQDPEVTKVLSTGGFTASHSTPAQLADRVKREYENWGKVIRSSNIRMD
jgi:tripartite-type tricarboxylate transporter receptor subunit TctC